MGSSSWTTTKSPAEHKKAEYAAQKRRAQTAQREAADRGDAIVDGDSPVRVPPVRFSDVDWSKVVESDYRHDTETKRLDDLWEEIVVKGSPDVKSVTSSVSEPVVNREPELPTEPEDPSPTPRQPDQSSGFYDRAPELPDGYEYVDPRDITADFWSELDPTRIPYPKSVVISKYDVPPPAKFKWYRPDQWLAVCEAVEHFRRGIKVVILDAPTGAGKTWIAESIRRILALRAAYTCTTKPLQAQVMRDFGEYARQIMGRGNYPTLDDGGATAEDCTKRKAAMPACAGCPGYAQGTSWEQKDVESDWEEEGGTYHCNFCHPWHQCPYEVAKFEAQAARLAVLNTAYLLAETNFVSNSRFRGMPLVILDEADKLEDALMSFIEVNVGPRIRSQLDIGLPSRKTVDSAWVEWLQEVVLPAIKQALNGIEITYDLFGKPDLKALRKRKSLTRLLDDVGSLLKMRVDEDGDEVLEIQDGWVYTGYEGRGRGEEEKPDKDTTVTFKPVTVSRYGHKFLFDRGQRYLLMSATVISAEQMASELGLEEGEWASVEMDSIFPAIRRPIIPMSTARVTFNTMEDAIPKLVAELRKIMDTHKGQRILVHSVSYPLTRDLFDGLGGYHNRRLVMYTNAQSRAGAIAKYLSVDDAVMIAPSLDRGVDFSGDDCRVTVICKVPYAYKRDKQVAARLYGTGKAGQTWYAVNAIRTICQMTGRGMRSPDDWCVTYILDSEFNSLFSSRRKLFPKWWSKAVIWDRNDPQWRDMHKVVGPLVGADTPDPGEDDSEEEDRPVPF